MVRVTCALFHFAQSWSSSQVRQISKVHYSLESSTFAQAWDHQGVENLHPYSNQIGQCTSTVSKWTTTIKDSEIDK